MTPTYAASETSGMAEELMAPIIYVDANPFIYFIDGKEELAAPLRPFFALLAERRGIAMTSELTLAEVLSNARRGYLNLIVWSNIFQLYPVTRDILIDTSDYRRVGRKKVKLPDAIHVVTAIRSRCRAFLSADKGLKLPPELSAFEPDAQGITNLMQEIS